MNEILKLRREVDEIDNQILLFLRERLRVSRNIGTVKRKHGVPIKDGHRENKVFTRIALRASELGLDPSSVEAIYQEIVTMCTKAQESIGTM